jgi:23S rRNA pseudouridine1911/1915/1917 synthase
VVAKDDATHRKLGEMFSMRRVAKRYIALLHGTLKQDAVTVNLPIARDLVRRTRMTTRRADGRNAVSHFTVVERLATRYGAFTLVEARIETGRTHQIRVHAQSLGHPVVGDTLYGAPRMMQPAVPKDGAKRPTEESVGLERNFLHAAHLEFAHPRTGKTVAVDAPLPRELEEFLALLRTERV